MTQAFRECTPVADGAPLRQGDVFVFNEDLASEDMWQQIGIVVTADCDLANNKHAGILSYVPVLPLHDYLAWRVLPKVAEEIRIRAVQGIVDLINQIETERGIEQGLSARAIEVFLTTTGGTKDLSTHFGTLTSDQESRIKSASAEIVACDSIKETSLYDEKFATLSSCLQPSKKKTSRELLVTRVNNQLKNMPGDAFFLGTLDQSRSQGYVAYLRLIREARIGQLSTSYFVNGGRGVVARRISRLRAPYIYRLTQMLADVFSSIGLPEEYETARAEAFTAHLQPRPVSEIAE